MAPHHASSIGLVVAVAVLSGISGLSVGAVHPSVSHVPGIAPTLAVGPGGLEAAHQPGTRIAAGPTTLPGASSGARCVVGSIIDCASPFTTGSATSLSWRNLSANSTHPSPRTDASLVYDGADRYLLLFGGIAPNGTALNDTWGFSHGSWRLLPEPYWAPTARGGATLTFSAINHEVFLFGGYTPGVAGPAFFSDVWTFYQGNWYGAYTDSGPLARYGAGLVATASGQMLLFGGCCHSGTSQPFNDTWLLSGYYWTNLTNSRFDTPGPRVWPVMALDSSGAGITLFGGDRCVANRTSESAAWNDTWTMSSTHSTWTRVATAFSPPASAWIAGSTGAPIIETVVVDSHLATWAYYGKNWHPTPGDAPPSARSRASFAIDPASGYGLLFGGQQCSASVCTTLGESWLLDCPACLHWKSVPSADSPPPRSFGMMTYDARDGYVLLFGGEAHGRSLNDTWTYQNGNWTNHSVRGPPGGPGALAYDSKDGYALFAGGSVACSGGSCIETWRYSAGNWTSLPQPGGAPSTGLLSLAYDPSYDQFVLYGGSTHDQTWTFDGSTWTEQSFSPSPPASTQTSLFFDPGLNGTVWMGAPSNQSWLLQSGSWTALSASPPPPGYGTSALGLDPVTGDQVAFGSVRSPFTNGSWTFDHGRWAPLWAAGAPQPQSGASMAFDPAEGGFVMVQGSGLPGTWRLYSPSVTPEVTPTTGLAPLEISYSGTVAGGVPPFQFLWSFGDGATSNSATGTHRFLQPGHFPVLVRVTDSAGARGSSRGPIEVVALGPLKGGFSAQPTIGDAPLDVSFASQVAGGLAPYSLRWSFGDGSYTTGGGAVHVYGLPGSYFAFLSGVDSFGTNFTSAPVRVDVMPAVQLRLNATPAALLVGEVLRLSAIVHGGIGGYAYSWSGLPPGCADANRSILLCAPSTTGVFAVTATVRDALGFASNSTVVIQVTGPPSSAPSLVVSLQILPYPVWSNQTVVLLTSVQGGVPPYSFAWEGLPPGCSPENSSDLSCVPHYPGGYTVVVQVTDSSGSVASWSSELLVLRLGGPISTQPLTVGADPHVSSAFYVGAAVGVILVLTVLGLLKARPGSRR